MNTAELIIQTLKEKLHAPTVQLQDETARHAHHEAAGSGGHYIVRIVSPDFVGKSRVERHQMVFKALDDIMDQVHALSIPEALTPEEAG